jgi:hypothetical protein
MAQAAANNLNGCRFTMFLLFCEAKIFDEQWARGKVFPLIHGKAVRQAL